VAKLIGSAAVAAAATAPRSACSPRQQQAAKLIRHDARAPTLDRARFAGGGFRKVSPSISMMCAWCSSRSSAALASKRSPKSGGHSSIARFDVMIVEPCS
jgi:hypothetical protein